MAIMSQKKGVSASMELLDGVTLLKEVGRRIAYLRISAKIKQSELAAKAGISRYALSRLENGAGGIHLESFLSVLRCLNVLNRLSVVLPEPSLTPLQAAELEKQSLPERVRSRRGGKMVRRWGDEVSAGGR